MSMLDRSKEQVELSEPSIMQHFDNSWNRPKKLSCFLSLSQPTASDEWKTTEFLGKKITEIFFENTEGIQYQTSD